jgi:hypothetical protein
MFYILYFIVFWAPIKEGREFVKFMPSFEKKESRFPFGLAMILSIAFVNHTLTFLAYDWYAGIDAYSYDVCGLQLITGCFFDVFPVVFRPPLIPILKNILYLFFEGHQIGLSLLIHCVGILSVFWAYRLGSRFNKFVGLGLGFLMAIDLNISVHFHHISSTTVFIPLLLLTMDKFVVWMQKPSMRSTIVLACVTFLSCMARTESLMMIPVFFISGLINERSWKKPLILLAMCVFLYNSVCFFYFVRFGYWGVTHNSGWSLYERLSRAVDKQFSEQNGPASASFIAYTRRDIPLKLELVDNRMAQMAAFNMAQDDFGIVVADNLLMRADREAILAAPVKFIKFVLLRTVCQMGLARIPSLQQKENMYETPTEHMWGFDSRRMQENRQYIKDVLPTIAREESPLVWERNILKARIRKIFLPETVIPAVPESFAMSNNYSISEEGKITMVYRGDGNMSERLRSSYFLDNYFTYGFWGVRNWSKPALSILHAWDNLRVWLVGWGCILSGIMWFLWLLSTGLSVKRWHRIALTSLLGICIIFALCQAVFSDNLGGRFRLYTMPYLWLGALCGLSAIRDRVIKRRI